jgi:hypothetical protein
MTTSTLLLIVLSFVIAVGLSYFQYLYKANDTSKTTYLLAFLRFISIFGILILLINPIISTSNFEIAKPPLVVVVDNSSSIKELNAEKDASKVIEKVISNSELNDKFDIQLFQFDNEFQSSDSLTFLGTKSKINEVGKSLKSIFRNKKIPTLLISDGNQTSGDDYVNSFSPDNKVYPVVLGDTTQFLDLKINQVNVNKYAFHKNKFPVEVFLQSNVRTSLNANFSISNGNKIISNQTLNFSSSKPSQTITILLPADKIGVQIYTASIKSNEKEKNTYNNNKKFAVEIIDQRTEIGLISSINHPDLGMLKRSIESNSQRKVTIINPLIVKDIAKYNILILYQPNSNFKKVFDQNKTSKINTWTITGTATDFSFLNQQQEQFEFKMASQKEDFLADYVPTFNLFSIENIGFEKFPPLENPYGKITAKTEVTTLLNSNIRSINSTNPLLSFYENQGRRGAYLFGSTFWKWRSNSFLETKSFEKFDLFMDKIIQFLSSNDQKKSLIVNHERFYNIGDNIEITAQYFNKNYEFDENAKLSINVFNPENKTRKAYDLLKSANNFKVNLEGLNAGNYTFDVKELNSNATYSSSFNILDFDVEKQFSNANLIKMTQLATQTNAKVYFPNQVNQLINSLLDNQEYVSIEKKITSKKPVIDVFWLLVLLCISLGAEWFTRKYIGLL